ncbi:MAG: redox-sensing transcriptional repressor Rex [Treponema sp.]|jgi:redox-sensing transcriptional repressor|nr:redox-sensing transcriptional repressor Rex [Treponema sp.]
MIQMPEPTKERLLHLMRILEKSEASGVTSSHIEGLTGWSSYTIRKDIAWLGGDYGSSSGYHPSVLVPAIKRALGLDQERRFCVVGLGRLGSAYLNLDASAWEEFKLIAGFDTNVNRVEILKSSVPLYPAYKMADIINRFAIELALLCVPEATAQGAAEKLVAAGIQGILNFAPLVVRVPPEIPVRNVYVVDALRSLSIQVKDNS